MTTTSSVPAFPPVLIKLDEDLCQCELVWATPNYAEEFLEENGVDFSPECLDRFQLSEINGDRAVYLPESPQASCSGPVVLQWNGDKDRCTEVAHVGA